MYHQTELGIQDKQKEIEVEGNYESYRKLCAVEELLATRGGGDGMTTATVSASAKQ